MTGNRAVVLVAIIAVIGSFVFYCYGLHPIVECEIDLPPVVYGEKGNVKLTTQNVGRSSANIRLHVILYNATISEETRTPYGEVTQGEATFNLFLAGKSEKTVEEVYFYIFKDAETFQVTYFVEKNPDISMPGAIEYLFGEFKPSIPTTYEYVRSGSHIYVAKHPIETPTDLAGK